MPLSEGNSIQMKIISTNKKAFFNYEIYDTYEAGISLMGSEVKSIREGRISLKESYAEIKAGEVFLINCHISPYAPAHKGERPRKGNESRAEEKALALCFGKIQGCDHRSVI